MLSAASALWWDYNKSTKDDVDAHGQICFPRVRAYGQLEGSSGEGSVFVLCVPWQPLTHLPPRSLAV